VLLPLAVSILSHAILTALLLLMMLHVYLAVADVEALQLVIMSRVQYGMMVLARQHVLDVLTQAHATTILMPELTMEAVISVDVDVWTPIAATMTQWRQYQALPPVITPHVAVV